MLLLCVNYEPLYIRVYVKHGQCVLIDDFTNKSYSEVWQTEYD